MQPLRCSCKGRDWTGWSEMLQASHICYCFLIIARLTFCDRIWRHSVLVSCPVYYLPSNALPRASKYFGSSDDHAIWKHIETSSKLTSSWEYVHRSWEMHIRFRRYFWIWVQTSNISLERSKIIGFTWLYYQIILELEKSSHSSNWLPV